jgi:hypothetical protein
MSCKNSRWSTSSGSLVNTSPVSRGAASSGGRPVAGSTQPTETLRVTPTLVGYITQDATAPVRRLPSRAPRTLVACTWRTTPWRRCGSSSVAIRTYPPFSITIRGACGPMTRLPIGDVSVRKQASIGILLSIAPTTISLVLNPPGSCATQATRRPELLDGDLLECHQLWRCRRLLR